MTAGLTASPTPMLHAKLRALTWYARRARAMSAPELAYRLRRRVRSERRRREAGTWPPLDAVVARQHERQLPEGIAEAALAALRERPRLWQRESNDDLLAWVAREHPEAVRATLDAAQRYRAGHYRFFDRVAELGTVPDWHAAPLSGRRFPLAYWTSIDYRGGGAKYVWELNRHQHLPTLARAYAYTGDEAYADLACRHLLNWIDRNPHLLGINWTSGIEMALRMVAWAWTLELIAPARALTPEAFGAILVTVHCQATFLEQNLSRYSSANNHLVAEAAGLVTAGTHFPWLAGAPRWCALGAEVLADETLRQIYDDGGGAEQAFHYLGFICDLVLSSGLLLERTGNPLPPAVGARIAAAGKFLGGVTLSAGRPPLVGDSDDGCALPLDDTGVAPVAAACARLAAYNGDPATAFAGIGGDVGAAWLLGAGAADRLRGLRATAPVRGRHTTFQASGYTTLRGRAGGVDYALLFDHGPLGYLSQAAHGHADALALWYEQEGVPLLVDSGTFTYHEDQLFRDYFRGAAAHNALVVDGAPQSVPLGPTIWGRKARVVDSLAGETGGVHWVTACHDGYARHPASAFHRRTVLSIPEVCVAVLDEVTGTGRHRVDLFWHVPAGAGCEVEDREAHLSIGDQRLRLVCHLPDGMDLGAVRGQTQPTLQGWTSERFGARTPAWVVAASGIVPLPCTILTLLVPGSTSAVPNACAVTTTEGHDRLVALTVDTGNVAWRCDLRAGRLESIARSCGRRPAGDGATGR